MDKQQPDVAIIADPNKLHIHLTQTCLNREIPCLVKKPEANTVVGAKMFVEHSAKTRVPILVGNHSLHNPDILEAHQLIQDGLRVDVVAVNGMWMADKPDSYFDAEWRKNRWRPPPH